MEKVVLGEVSVRLDERVVVRPEGKESLTPREADLIAYLLRNPGPVTRDELKVEVWGYHPDVASRAVHHTVTRLRRKLELDPAEPRFLKTIRGAGYLLQGWTWADVESGASDARTLPPETGPFFGRQVELAHLQVLLQEAPLVTVVGTGGVGKTRLVVRAGHLRPDGAWFCALAGARSEEELVQAVCSGLELDGVRGDAVEAVGEALSARRDGLVVLDNAEHLAVEVARLIEGWQRQAPHMRFVVTSRAPLGLDAEQVLRLEPLPTPTPDAADVLQVPSLQLLCARIEAADPTFDPQTDVAGLVRVAEEVAGLPLALELAGSRARLLTPTQMADRLEQGRPGLGVRGEGAAHQRSIEATVDWSWVLLGDDAQRTLAQVSVFRGGFDLASAERVVDVPDVAAALDELIEASLVTAARGRLSLLEPIRRVAAARLGDARALVEARHGAWFAERGTPAALEELDWHPEHWPAARLDLDNLRAACERAVARGDVEVAVSTFRAVWTLLEGRAVELGRSVQGLQIEDTTRVELIWRIGWGLALIGDEAAAERRLSEAAALADTVGNRTQQTHALVGLASVLHSLGRVEDSLEVLDRAEEVAAQTTPRLQALVAGSRGGHGPSHEARGELERALGLLRRHTSSGPRYPIAAVTFLVNLANLYRDVGLHQDAATAYDAALALTGARGVGREHGVALANRAVLWHLRGDVAQAESVYLQALDVLERCGERRYEAVFRGNLGELYQDSERLEQARPCLERALGTHLELGNELMVALSRGRLGRLALAQGCLTEAVDLLTLAVDDLEEGYPRAAAVFQASLGEARGLLGHSQAAVALLDRAEAVLAEEGWPRELVECLCARARVLASAGGGGATAALRRAVEVASPLGVTPTSVLARDLERTRAMVGPRRRSA